MDQEKSKEALEQSEVAEVAEPANVSAAPDADDENQELDQGKLMEEYDISGRLRKGEVKKGTVVEEREDGWLIDVGYKCEGFLPAKEWTHRILVESTDKPRVNDELEVQVINIREGEENQLLLSRWRHEFDRRWALLEEKLEQSETIQVKGLRKVNGGIIVDCCGLEGFIPISHLSEMGKGISLSDFIDRTFEVKPLERDRRKHRLVFSRRDLVAKEAAEQRAKFYDEVHEGDIKEGEVSSITDFGVFVNIGSMDGLVHVSEITWKRNVRIRDAYKKGDKVTVKVIGMDKERDRISLSIKQVQGDPWDTVSERIHNDDVMTGPITNVTDFGAFVELEPGIEGLVHIGDISWSRIRHPKEVFHKGQEIQVVVLGVDTEKRRISLGYKQLNDPWREIAKKYTVGEDIMVKVVRLAEFGAFVEAEEGVEALIHISQMSTKRVEKPSDVLKEGQEVKARVIEVNPEQRRMRLSLSALEAPVAQPQPAEEEGEHEHEVAEEKPQAQPRPQQQRRRPARKSGGEDRRAAQKDTIINTEETLQYNPFADAFKNQSFDD